MSIVPKTTKLIVACYVIFSGTTLRAFASGLPGQHLLLACPFSAPNDDLGYAPPSALTSDDASNDEDDDNDQSSKSSDGAVAAYQPTKNECLFFGGSVTSGLTLQRNEGPFVDAGMKGKILTPGNTLGEVDISHVTSTEYGDLITRYSWSFTRSTDVYAVRSTSPSIIKATIAIGPWLAGFDTSTFNTWTGDPFSFAAFAPSATTGLIARQFSISPNSTLSLAIEDPATQRLAYQSSFAGQGPVPDIVARYRWANSQFDVILTAASHVIDYWRGSGPKEVAVHDTGFAAKAYVKVNVPTATDGSYVLGQVTYGKLTPAYLGIATNPGTAARFELSFGDALSAYYFEHGNGWSADVVGNYAINDKWQTSIFGSFLDYRWYSVQAVGTQGHAIVHAFRTAWNTTFTPVTNLTISGELGYGFQQSTKLEGITYPVVVGSNYHATLTVGRSF